MEVVRFSEAYLDDVFLIQQKAYSPLYEKYHDEETNPYLESKELVHKKYTRPGNYGYVFLEDGLAVGAVRIIPTDDVCKVSALAVLPEYQNRGIAQTALREIEEIHSNARLWVLDTLMQEKGNCHLYEKLGYVRVGEPRVINDKLTLVDYEKHIEPRYDQRISEADCPFCGIVSKKMPGRIIYEDEFTCVFLDIAGDVNYHMVAIPKKHVSSILDCDADTLSHLMETVQRVSQHCIKIGFEGVNLLNASGPCAGQSVPHYHIHIIPRKTADGINAWPELPGSTISIEAAEQMLKIK